MARDFRAGAMLAAALLLLYGGVALTVDFPRAAMGIQSDEATYYMMGHSLAEDGDITYRKQDLVRVWKEFPSGPAGLFLKRGSDIQEWGLMLRPPFVWTRTLPDPDPSRLFYGKSFIYPLAAAPFVKVFGTNGFLVLHALLLAAVIWCAFLFLHARAPAIPSAVLAGAFVLATVVPVYFVWITPELFNFAVVFFAYFSWLYKEVEAPDRMPRAIRWLASGRSDAVAALLLGIATFSKPSNALLLAPIAVYLAWRRQFVRAAAVCVLFTAVTGALFAANVAISGEWNYQGGNRKTFVWEFPFQTPAASFDSINTKAAARDEALTSIIFDWRVFWTNLFNNLKWYFVGRYSGLVAYFALSVFALGAFLAAPRRRPLWQWLVLGSGVAQILLFVISLPHTWFGGGGSVGNRYFMGVYGIFLFLMPPISSVYLALLPWIAGGLFVGKLVINPFASSMAPGTYADRGPLRWLPVELTNVNDLPINTASSRVRVPFGDDPGTNGSSNPFFQIYFLDMNWSLEADKSFWVKGESRAEFLIKTDRPMKRLVLTLFAGPHDVNVTARVNRRKQDLVVPAEDSREIIFTLDRGFPYLGTDDRQPRFVWVASVSASNGFVPLFLGNNNSDTRFLGVRVKPRLVE
jgi:hypothetical protein